MCRFGLPAHCSGESEDIIIRMYRECLIIKEFIPHSKLNIRLNPLKP